MAKSFTVLQKDIADSIRFQTLTQPPEVVELAKLSEDIEKILKKPHNYIQTGIILDNYYNKLIRFMTVMKTISQKSLGTPVQSTMPNQHPLQQSPSTTANPSSIKPDDGNDGNATPVNTDTLASQQSLTQTFTTPGTSSTPHQQTAPDSSSIFTSPISALTASPIKKDLLNKMALMDDSFLLDNSNKSITLNHKNYTLNDFNQLFSKLRDRGSLKKGAKNLTSTEIEIIEVIRKSVENNLQSEKMLKNLPGLAEYIAAQSPRTVTRSRKHSKKPSQISATPIADKTKKNKKLLGSTLGTGISKRKPLGKVHFKRWSNFIRYIFEK